MAKRSDSPFRGKRPRPRNRRCIGLIGDLVQSKRYRGAARAHLQKRLEAVLAELNRAYSDAVLSKFIITAGDEFQGLLTRGQGIPDLVWDLEEQLPGVQIRLGVGCGHLETELTEFAVGMDGPVWHGARAAIEEAETSQLLGGVFRGFGERSDVVLGGLARVLGHLRTRLSPKQRRVVSLLRRGLAQREIAGKLRITEQAVSQHVRAAAWRVYREGEDAWRAALAGHDFTHRWQDR